jgi:hypothetical protein
MEILMHISSVKPFKRVPSVVKVLSADRIQKPVIDKVVNEHHQSHGSYIVDTSTVIFGVSWVKAFRVSVGHNFFNGRICLSSGVSVPI